MKVSSNQVLVRMLGALAVACAVASACAREPQGAPPAAVAGPAGEAFKSAGKEASITVYPTRFAGKSVAPIGEVVAMMLERAGMTRVETTEASFEPAPGVDPAGAAAAFGEFIRANPPATEYAFWTEFVGTPQEGASEVRGVVVNKQGEVVWHDRQAKGDADFDRVKPREPMECCLLVVNRLRPALGLDDPTKRNAPKGKVGQRWAKQSGLPDDAELAAIEARGKAFRRVAATSTLAVYPAHAGEAYSAASAKAIAARVNEEGLAKASAAETPAEFEIARGMNQQKSLWSLAREFSDHIRKNPPEGDFALLADYIMGNGGVAGVNFVICDKAGEIVAVDLQNSHWPDFKTVNPTTREDCDRLVMKRLAAVCR